MFTSEILLICWSCERLILLKETNTEYNVLFSDWILSNLVSEISRPSTLTPIVQQNHIIDAHILCSLIERTLCPRTSA